MSKHIAKDLLDKEKIIKLPISKFINTNFKDYAIYVLEQRGIPNFYDALTPVQRYILKNSPTSFVKTLTVVGKSIEDGYHHSNTSLEGAINKLAKPFGNAISLLEGDGFFGTEASPHPAACRYTSVRLNPKIGQILTEYKHLHTRQLNGPHDPLWLSIPIGLLTTIVGISVGYKTTILPRKYEDIISYLQNKRKSLTPYFEGYGGKIEKYNGLNNSWLFTSNISIEKQRITIKDIPPLIKYESLSKRLYVLLQKYESYIKIIDNSDIKISIEILYSGKSQNEFNDIIDYVKRITSIVATESIVFIKDNSVLMYDSIEQYLDDYKWQLLRLNYTDTKFKYDKLLFDIDFTENKIKFIEFILSKKRTDIEISEWLSNINKEFISKLENLTARKFTKDELIKSKNELSILKKNIKETFSNLKILEQQFNSTIDPTLQRGKMSKRNSSISLFDEDDIYEDANGITIWNATVDEYEIE